MKSTVHLTGEQSATTKQRMIDLLAPSKAEVVITTAAGPHSRSSSYTDLAALGNGYGGGGGGAHGSSSDFGAFSYRGEFRADDPDSCSRTERATEDGLDGSVVSGGDSALGTASASGVRRGGNAASSKVFVGED